MGVPDTRTNYSKSGPPAVLNLEEDRTNKAIRWRGTEVFEAQPFDIDFQNEHTDLLLRDRAVGEYFVIKQPVAQSDTNLTSYRYTETGDIERYDIETNNTAAGTGKVDRSIWIFSAEDDDYREIKYSEARKYVLNNEDFTHADTNARLLELRQEMEQLINRNKMKRLKFQAKLQKKLFREKITVKKPYAETYVEMFAIDPATTAAIQDTAAAAAGWATPIVATTLVAAGTPAAQAAANGLAVVAACAAYDSDTIRLAIETQYRLILEETPNPDPNATLLRTYGRALDIQVKLITDRLDKLAQSIEKGLAAAKPEGLLKDDDKFEHLTYSWFAYLKVIYALEIILFKHEMEFKVPADVLLLRPWQTYQMASAILAEGGADLGETFHGHHDFQLSDDVIRKVHLGHYTHYSKSVVKRPNYYQIVEDIFAQGYIGGEGTEFFTKATLDEKWQQGDLQTSECSESLIAWLIPASHTPHLKECIDITGKYDNEHGVHDEKEHFFGANGLAELLHGLGTIAPNKDYLEVEGYVNTLCFRGKQLEQKGDSVEVAFHNKGHWGNLTYPGCMSVREGQAMYGAEIREEKNLNGLLTRT